MCTDFLKLSLYTAFFCVLFTFYGLPIHIIRDLFMTTRSFVKRLTALLRYRQALKDMDQYPDATPEDLGQEDTCIICREDMRPWDPASGQVERTRAKKLPCGHILHFGCLKSWLERQQVCPTCRSPVAREGQQQQPAARNGEAVVFRLGFDFPAGRNQQAQPPANGQAPAGQAPQAAPQNNQDNNNNNNNNGVRMFNLGPLRLGFAQGGVNDINEMAQRLGLPAGEAVNPPVTTPPVPAPQTNPAPNLSLDQIRAQILDVGQRIQQEMQTLQTTAQELQTLNFVVNELARLRQVHQQQAQGQQQGAVPNSTQPPVPTPAGQPGILQGQLYPQAQPFLPPMFPQQPGQFPMPQLQPLYPPFTAPRSTPAVTRHGAAGYGGAIPSGSPELPEGVVIPPGWSLLPLQRLDGGAQATDPAPANSNSLQTHIQELLNPSLQPPNGVQPSQGGSATVTGQSSAQSERNISADSADTASTQEPESSQGTTDSSDPTSVPVSSPTPVAPNWGGPAQLFGGSASFRFSRDPSPAPTDQSSARVAEGAAEGPAEGSASVSGEGASSSEANAGQNGSASTKNKGKAVMVEDADDDEDDY